MLPVIDLSLCHLTEKWCWSEFTSLLCSLLQNCSTEWEDRETWLSFFCMHDVCFLLFRLFDSHFKSVIPWWVLVSFVLAGFFTTEIPLKNRETILLLFFLWKGNKEFLLCSQITCKQFQTYFVAAGNCWYANQDCKQLFKWEGYILILCRYHLSSIWQTHVSHLAIDWGKWIMAAITHTG